MRLTVLFLFLSILIACRPTKKVQKVQVPKVEVVSPPVVTSIENKAVETEATRTSVNVYNKINKNKIIFNTFHAKLRAKYELKEGADEATVFVRIKKDSVIWMSLRGPLGIEGFRILVTPESVQVMDLLKKSILYRNIGYLKELTNIPFDFNTLQDFVVGNPIFFDTSITSYNLIDNRLSVLITGKAFNHLLTLDHSDFRLFQSKLDISGDKNLTLDMSYSDYENSPGTLFAKTRKILVSDQTKMDILLEFKQFSFNQPVTFPFNIPKNYKKL